MKLKMLVLLTMMFSTIIFFSQKNVLILHSYQSDYKWTNSVQEGIEEIFEGKDINFYVEYMDAKRFSGDEFEGSLAEYYKAKYKSRNIEYILLSDDRALSFLFRYREEVFGDIPVFFCGINAFTLEDFENRNNYYGIIEDIDFIDTISFMNNTKNNLQKVYVINDDYVYTSKAILNAIKAGEAQFPELEFIYLKEYTIDEIIITVAQTDENAVVYLGTFILDRDEKYYFTDEILDVVSENSKMPVYISWSFFLDKDNIIGGLIINGKTQGKNMANMFLDYLNGKGAYITDKSEKEYIIDYSVLEKYGLRIQDTEKPIVYINKKDNTYEILINIIWVSALIIAVILILYLYTSKKLKRKIKKLDFVEKKNREIQKIIDNVPARIFAKDKNGRFLFANKVTASFFKTDTESIKGKKCFELNRVSEYEAFCMEEEENKVLDSGMESIKEESFGYDENIEYFRTTRIPFSFGDESINSILGIAVDITELKNKNEELTASYEELQAMNEELKVLYDENEKLLLRIEKLTSLSLTNYEQPEELFNGFFRALKELIPETKTCLFIEEKKDNLYFKDSFGIDISKFKSQPVNEFMKRIDKVIISDDFFDKNNFSITEKEESMFKEYIGRVNRTLVIPIKTRYMNYGFYILNLKDKYRDFSPESLRLTWFFSSIINLYLMINEHKDEMFNSYVKFSKKLAMIAEAYDEDTGNHIDRVGELSGYIAEKLQLEGNFANEIRNFAPLHDIGKIFISKNILLKEGPLDDEEWKKMKKHTSYAYKLLADDENFKTALNIALYHHEKYDGTGYPFGKKGNDIPIEAAIVSLVDVYDALRSKRPYKKAFTHKETMDIIANGTERTHPSHFNPEVHRVFVENHMEIEKLWIEIKD